MFIKTHAPQNALIMQLLPVLQEASQILFEEYQSYTAGSEFNIHQKSDNSPVTQADLKINRFLMKALAKIQPIYPVLSEENDNSDRHEWPICWMLDPLDGTKEFIHERDEFTINLSLIENTKTIFSIIIVPCEQQMYLGFVNERPYKYQFNHGQWWRYQIADKQEITQLQVGLSHSSKNTKYQQLTTFIEQDYPVVRREAGSAYKFCMMLEGEIDLYPRFHPTSEWDTSAGQGLLESIGGGLITLKGQPFQYNKRDTILNAGFLAFTTPEIKDLALNALKQLQITD
ncbi:3'(2'),5'-bisphosphate nucleotidase CysQ [Acinetobacter sp. S40]|uniref:3'(2'),5'-bisphosphate nucleotidase CysQ family protein n=1 Tax=Acinetobacter sp. S40 TaxID=2767434 RepID=UPI00190B4FA7|nr:3'(2'),5'-bisphosphate nucleotidase CysQ [Acinetobacter sp. S40]MBJ9985147.1 3'(2'),5'-bisphosphate nucleotidase CysQ [Acinetobacter sp. S40]